MSEHRGALTAEGELYPSPRRALDFLETDPPESGRAVEIGTGLYWARIPLPMELNHINVWLLAHEDGWMLVDTGLAEDVCREAWRSLETQRPRWPPVAPDLPDARPSGSHGTLALAARASRCPGVDVRGRAHVDR